ncbi:hypothetical protein BMETH_27542803391760, partial [methanotrophic bacterial endosymbiont of Bathymodiolus sp.]
ALHGWQRETSVKRKKPLKN